MLKGRAICEFAEKWGFALRYYSERLQMIKIVQTSILKALIFVFCLISFEAFGVDIEKEEALDMGSFFDDKALVYHFDFENFSPSNITDIKLTTSCGCTTVKYTGDTIAPKEKLPVEVNVDLTGKRGKITKGVIATFKKDGVEFEKEFSVKFVVKKNVDGHQATNLKEVLFNEKCGSCHAKPAEGKLGKELFVAVCAFCHGENAQGVSAMGFTKVGYYQNFDVKRIRAVIENGTPQGEMPGFSREQGGPLDRKQIETLVGYFQDLKVEITK